VWGRNLRLAGGSQAIPMFAKSAMSAAEEDRLVKQRQEQQSAA